MILFKKIFKTFTFSALAMVFVFGFIEFFLRTFDFLYSPKILRNYTLSSFEVFKNHTKHISDADKMLFCDFIHQKKQGNVLFSSCIKDFFKKNNLSLQNSKIIALGGSTTEGNYCEPNTSWTAEFEKMTGAKVVNLGKSGEESNFSLSKINEYFKPNSIKAESHIYILEGDWINEILSPRSKDTQIEMQFLLLKSYAFLYRYSYIFRSSSNLYNNLSDSMLTNLDVQNFVIQQNNSLEQLPLNKINIQHANVVEFAIKKYLQNMIKLEELSKKEDFKVLVINFPYVKNYYSIFSVRLNNFFENKWIPAIKRQQKIISNENNFLYVDVESCFDEYKKSIIN